MNTLESFKNAKKFIGTITYAFIELNWILFEPLGSSCFKKMYFTELAVFKSELPCLFFSLPFLVGDEQTPTGDLTKECSSVSSNETVATLEFTLLVDPGGSKLRKLEE